MLKLLRSVRIAYKHWKALAPEERDQFAAEIQRIRSLVRELGGSRALHFVENDADDADSAVDEPLSHERERPAVIAELKEATTELLAKMAAPAGRVASGTVPRSIRLGGRVMSAGSRRLGRKPADS